MAPGRREPSIDRTSEYEDFIAKLSEYHETRGTTLDPQPKVGPRHLDLLRLYKRVVEEGGYDLCSDTKEKPLMWRKFAEEFLGKSAQLAAQAFQVKSAYYKNLVAYEISTHWKKDPPPKEILEDITAKGGGVMNRTLENFEKPESREAKRLTNGRSTESPEPEQTPKQDKMDVDDPNSANGRSTRGLRQAPPQRVLFQPEVTTRQTRNANNQVTSPSPGALGMNSAVNGSYFTNGSLNTTLANYEPRQQYPLSLKPVTTPANNPEHYRLKRKQLLEARISQVAKKGRGLMLPGTGFIGPNIYVRAQLALQSGLPEEEQYALHHLVKISHERGDKYRFDQFAGLAEALVNKVLQVSNLFYDVEWVVSYDGDARPDSSRILDGVRGTRNVVGKLRSHVPLDTDDDVQAAEFTQALGRITEAGLVLRNMVMLDENAQYIAKLPLIRDYFAIVLHIKPHPSVIELQLYALETAEQLTRYFDLDSQDLVYRALLDQLDSNDRGKIVTSLRAIARIGMNLEANKRLEDVPLSVLRNICEWMMVEDEELRSACLDFLYQFTSIADNVEVLAHNFDLDALVRQLSRLLLFNAREDVRYEKPRTSDQEEPESTLIPKLANELVGQLLRYEEPERSSHWLRMCFKDDPNAEMTQIHLWQSYQSTFVPYSQSHPHLIAGDFIKNVSSTFQGAAAQVAGTNKYVIRGIKPRRIPVDYRGKELAQCNWHMDHKSSGPEFPPVFANSEGSECGEWFADGSRLLYHILSTHLKIPRKQPTSAANGETSTGPVNPLSRPSSTTASSLNNFDFAGVDPNVQYSCRWGNCNRHHVQASTPNAAVHRALLARHIETHLPDGSGSSAWRRKHNGATAPSQKREQSRTRVSLNTMVDERNDAAGLPLGAVLVLRNIARGIPKIKTAEGVDGKDDEDAEDAQSANKKLMKRVFGPVKERLFFALAHNLILKEYLGVLVKYVAQGGG